MSNLIELCKANLETCTNYWTSVNLLIAKAHTVNKRLAGSLFIAAFHLNTPLDTRDLNKLSEACRSITNGSSVELVRDTVERCSNVKIASVSDKLLNFTDKNILTGPAGFILLHKLIPKNLRQHPLYYELVVLDLPEFRTTFIPFGKENEEIPPYQLHLFENSLYLRTLATEGNLLNWLKNVFFKKFLKWCGEQPDVDGGGKNMAVQSLSLVNLEEYNRLYNELKGKYGENMVKIWPERTDPAKFVYEDIAIASYLLLIWKDERQRLNLTAKQSFVDIGCGNGLLVYILSSEGHTGYGIDLRRRGIWDLYPDTTILKTETITPSDQYLFPTIDWIIGNHSDELSPWIPVIAARSSHATRFFLLPCCAYEFDGSKYQRKSCKQSQYNDFLDYVWEIALVCGFNVAIDRLKIPSTKRVCIVGMERNWSSAEMPAKCEEIQRFIDQRTGRTSDEVAAATGSISWSENFKPRSVVEKVQNCTKIDKNTEREIIKIIFDHLITKKRFVTTTLGTVRSDWNIGGTASLGDLAKMIPIAKLKALKEECGGLQTLLKNNHQIFLVQRGTVQVRPPVSYPDRLKQPSGKEFSYKQKPCWFLANHPDGCPFTSDDCSFKH